MIPIDITKPTTDIPYGTEVLCEFQHPACVLIDTPEETLRRYATWVRWVVGTPLKRTWQDTGGAIIWNHPVWSAYADDLYKAMQSGILVEMLKVIDQWPRWLQDTSVPFYPFCSDAWCNNNGYIRCPHLKQMVSRQTCRVGCQRKKPQPKMVKRGKPTLTDMAVHFSKAMVRWAGKGYKTVSKDEYIRRREICSACHGGWRCPKCGCMLWAKSALATETCEKWEKCK